MVLADVECQRSIRSYELKLADNLKHDVKSLFAYASYKRGKPRAKIGPLRRSDGSLTSCSTEVADALSDQFKSVFNQQPFVPPVAYQYRSPSMPMCSVFFDALEVRKILVNLKTGTSPGPDNIPNAVLKNCADSLSVPLSKLFSRSMNTSNFPWDWKLGYVAAIHKSLSKLEPSHYRPIILTSTVSKVMELVVRNQMLTYALDNQLLNRSQHGFLPGRSTVTQLLYFLDLITGAVDDGDWVDCVMLDFSKAFDTVSHDTNTKYNTKYKIYLYLIDS